MREKILRLLNGSGLVLSSWSHQWCPKKPWLTKATPAYHSGMIMYHAKAKTPTRGPTRAFEQDAGCPKPADNPPASDGCPKPPASEACPPPPSPPNVCDDEDPSKKKKPPSPPEDECKKGNKKKLLLGLLALLLAGLLAGGAYWWLQQPSEPPPLIAPPLKQKCPKRTRRKPQAKFPPTSKEIPDEVPYLIIGGGTAAFAAFRAIKCRDPKAQVLVVSEETYFPYMRPPLSKELVFAGSPERADSLMYKQSNGGERSIMYEPIEFFLKTDELKKSENGGVSVAGGWKVKSINVEKKQVCLEDGKIIKYNKALLATGSSPRELPIFQELDTNTKDRITNYRAIPDYQDLEDVLKEGAKKFTVVGGGFLGCELAAGLIKRPGVKVIQIFLEDGVINHVLPKYLSDYALKKLIETGVEVKKGRDIVKATSKEGCVTLELDDGTIIESDYVLVAAGAVPNTELAEGSGLEVDSIIGGFLVNTELEARTGLYAAGDAACFYDPQFGRRRIEHHDQAIVSGRLAGENMTGSAKPFRHQPMFWSEFGPIVFEGIGVIDSELPTIGVFAKPPDGSHIVNDPGQHDNFAGGPGGDRANMNSFPCPPKSEPGEGGPGSGNGAYDKGVVFYMEGKKIVGIVAWNLCNRMPVARQVLKSDREYEDINEVAKLFNIHGKN